MRKKESRAGFPPCLPCPPFAEVDLHIRRILLVELRSCRLSSGPSVVANEGPAGSGFSFCFDYFEFFYYHCCLCKIMSMSFQDIKPNFLEESPSVSFIEWTDGFREDSDSVFHSTFLFGTFCAKQMQSGCINQTEKMQVAAPGTQLSI